MLFQLWTCVFFLLAVSARADFTDEQEAAVKLLGPEALELFRELQESKRGTLTCLCPAEKSEVCGDDGKRYFNECAATCRRVNVACNGNCPCDPPVFETGLPPDTQLWHDVGEDTIEGHESLVVGGARKLLMGGPQ